VRDLTRYRVKTVQARRSEIQRLGKALESAGIKLGSVASGITGQGRTAMIEALIGGERRGPVIAAVKGRGRLRDRYNRLVRRFGGPKNPGAKKKAIVAIAHTLLKIAYSVLKTRTPHQDLGAGFYTRRESPAQRQAWLERQLQELHPGCTVTVTIVPPPGHAPEAALPPGP
jgi:hypothetical protein